MRSIGSVIAMGVLLSASACSSAGSGSVKDSAGAPPSGASATAQSSAPVQASAAQTAASPYSSGASSGATATLAAPSPVALPGGAPGIGFDDLGFSAEIGRVLVPAGRTGNVDLIDPASGAVTSIGGFTTGAKFEGGHDFGVTSACVHEGLLFATDRSSQKLVVADIAARKIVGEAKLAAGPDYVRWVAATNEVWVTEPDADQIEIFTVPAGKSPTPVHAATIATKGGPESLVIDAKRGRAYSHLWKGSTIALDLKQRSIAATWPNGCGGSRGIDLDEANGILFAGCAEGKLVTLDVATGKEIASAQSGSGVDIIAFSPSLRHLYFPGGKSKTMAVFGVSAKGDLTTLGTVATADGAHCVAADTSRHAFVCDPHGGQLLEVTDPFPASR